jgi:hypothetical protein
MRPGSKAVYRRLMVLKYVISHSYRNISADLIKAVEENWTDSDTDDLEKELKKNMEETVASIKGFGLWKYATKSEKAFLSSFGSNMDIEEQVNSNWRMEAAVMLMWALKILDKYPDLNEQSKPDILQKVEIKKLGLFFNEVKLRSVDEIDHMRDMLELWHWRVNTRRLIEDDYEFVPDEQSQKAGTYSLDDIVKKTAETAYQNGDLDEIIDKDFVFRGQPFRDLSTEDFQEATSIIIERHYALNWLCGYAPKNDWDETPTDT